MLHPQYKKHIREWGKFLMLAGFLFAGRSAVVDWNRIPSGSMEPTIYVGDLVLVNKLAYDLKVPFTTTHLTEWSAPKRGEIVVFYHPQDGRRMVKRVIGEPGDTIELRENILIINGLPVSYHLDDGSLTYPLLQGEQNHTLIATEYLPETSHVVMALPSKAALRSFGPVRVPENEFFMLGDNRDDSGDSRYFGFVERKQIVGRAQRVLVSWDKENYYKPRFKRFMQALV